MVDKLFPGTTTEGVLQISDRLEIPITKYLAKNGIVGDTERATFISVGDEDCFNSVGQNGHTMSLDEIQKYHVLGSSLDAKNRVERSIKGFHLFNH